MIDAAEQSRKELDEAVRAVIADASRSYGHGDAAAERFYPIIAERGAHDRLFDEVKHAVPGIDPLAKPIRYLEVGSGPAAFLLSVLERGHDAYGIDLGEQYIRLARAKIAAFDLPSAWRDRIILGDASATPFESNSFDLVLGHQFIEHVDHVPATMTELVRVTKPGGHVVLWAPDYRGPYEPHYALPWPIFPTRPIAECWVECFDRPTPGLDSFNYVTLPQLIAIGQVLACDVISAGNDRPIDPNAHRWFDTSTLSTLRESAKRIQAAMASGSLPAHLTGATSLGITLRKR